MIDKPFANEQDGDSQNARQPTDDVTVATPTFYTVYGQFTS